MQSAVFHRNMPVSYKRGVLGLLRDAPKSVGGDCLLDQELESSTRLELEAPFDSKSDAHLQAKVLQEKEELIFINLPALVLVEHL